MLFGVDRSIVSNWRFEYKYRIPYAKYLQLRAGLTPYVVPDHYAEISPKGRYYLRSLYYDTADYRAYHEKMGGDFGRTKLRIRSYDRTLTAQSVIRAELKTRRGTPMEKFSAFVSPQDYEHYMSSKRWDDEENPVLVEFARLVRLRELSPKLVVEYCREGLVPRSRDDVRVTFDFDVRSTSATTLFPTRSFWRHHHRDEVIFEVKCRKDIPHWLAQIIKQHGIKPVANSKYTRAVEVCRNDVVTPMWTQGFVVKR
jgi:hypothetical protein